MTTDNNDVAFKAINDFVNELSGAFGEEQHSLKLYAHLISKTTTSHVKPVQKHVDAFRIFCDSNREAILNKDITKIETPNVLFSSKVYINVKGILSAADNATRAVIWQHLLTLLAIISPDSNTKKVLVESVKKPEGKEDEFLSDIIEKVKKSTAGTESNPLAAVSNIMSSGIFSDLVSQLGDGMEDGSINMDRMMGSIQTMVADNGSPDVANMMGDIVGKLKNTKDGETPDIGGLMSGLMGQLGPGVPPDLITNLMSSVQNGQTPDVANIMGQIKDNPDVANIMGQIKDNPDVANIMGQIKDNPDVANIMGQIKDNPDVANIMGQIKDNPDVANIMGQIKDNPDVANIMGQIKDNPDVANIMGQIKDNQ